MFRVRRSPFGLVFWERRYLVLPNALLGKIRTVLPAMLSSKSVFRPGPSQKWLISFCVVDSWWACHGCRARAQVSPRMLSVFVLSLLYRRWWLVRSCREIQTLLVNYLIELIITNLIVVIIPFSCSGSCYKRQMQPLSQKVAGGPTIRVPHSIQLLALGPVPEGQCHNIKLAVQDDVASKLPKLDVYRGLRISE